MARSRQTVTSHSLSKFKVQRYINSNVALTGTWSTVSRDRGNMRAGPCDSDATTAKAQLPISGGSAGLCVSRTKLARFGHLTAFLGRCAPCCQPAQIWQDACSNLVLSCRVVCAGRRHPVCNSSCQRQRPARRSLVTDTSYATQPQAQAQR